MMSVGSVSAPPPLSSKIAIPSGVDAFAATVSPRGVDLEDRLDCSLDALIKERRKEHKLAKKSEKQEEEAKTKRKHDKPQQQKKMQQQQQQRKHKQVAGIKHGQAQKRKALVNKNRGLPALPPAGKHANHKNGGKQLSTKGKTSIEATTAMMRRQMRALRTSEVPERLVVSPKATKNTQKQRLFDQQTKRKTGAPQTRKSVVQARQTRRSPPKNAKGPAKAPARQVTRTNDKKTKLKITVTAKAYNNKKAQRQQTKGLQKVLLPGKVSQAFMRKQASAQKPTKRTKNWKAAAGKPVQVVRQPFGQRKKKN